jgi:hypothetical protein
MEESKRSIIVDTGGGPAGYERRNVMSPREQKEYWIKCRAGGKAEAIKRRGGVARNSQ